MLGTLKLMQRATGKLKGKRGYLTFSIYKAKEAFL